MHALLVNVLQVGVVKRSFGASVASTKTCTSFMSIGVVLKGRKTALARSCTCMYCVKFADDATVISFAYVHVQHCFATFRPL